MNFWQDKRVIVTGGAGFLGSYVVEKLKERGCKNIFVPLVEDHDLTKEKNVIRLYQNYPCDIVIHLATYPRAKIVDEDPIVGIPKVINTTTNLLWHSSKWNIKKFVYVSSSMVYGDFADGTKEDASTKPKNIYGEAKLTGERMVKLFAKKDNFLQKKHF